MSLDDALGRLGQSTSEACLGVLEMFAAGKVSAGEMTAKGDAKAAFAGLPVPAVAMSVSYVDGVTGVDASQEILEALPAGGGRLEVIEGAGHFPWLDVPDAYWPVIEDFVTRPSAAP